MKVSIKVVFILAILFNGLNIKTFPQTQRNPVLEFCTGTWCQWCPCGHLVVENILATIPNAIILGYHGPATSSDPYAHFAGNSIISAFGFTGYPTGIVDRVSGIQSRSAWYGLMNTRNSIPATVSIEVDADFNPVTREFTVTIDFIALTNLVGQYKYNVILLEDGIVWGQTGNSSCTGDPNYIHKNVVRDMMNGALGEEIINGTWNLNEIITKSINHIIPIPPGPGPDIEWDSCNVVVMVYKVGSPLGNNGEIQQAEKYPLTNMNVPYVGIISPNGGESWAGGSDQTIAWTSNLVSDVKIEYSTDGGINWVTIIDSITNAEIYDWNIPYTVSNDCKIKLSDATNVAVSDESDNSFTIYLMEILVDEGWNMIAVPLHPSSMAVSDLFSNAISPAYGYNGGYYTADTLKNGFGYWIKFDSTEVIFNGGNQVDSTIVPVNNGWNIIGPFHENVNLASIITVPDNLFISPFYGYLNGYHTTTELNIGEGYWVKTWSDGLIIMNNGNLSKDEENDKTLFIQKEWGKIIITDATGKIFTLYAVKSEVNLDNYELPPAPPAGMFDIRFRSGRIAEDINSSIQTIDMSGVTYPLTVSVESMDIRLQDETGKMVNVILKSGEDVVISNATIQKLMVTGELIPKVYALEQNYPNPFNPSTTIEFSLPEDVSNVKLSIYNALGERVAEIVNTSLVAGKYQYQWNAKNVATGMYIYELRTAKFISIKKMVLLR